MLKNLSMLTDEMKMYLVMDLIQDVGIGKFIAEYGIEKLENIIKQIKK